MRASICLPVVMTKSFIETITVTLLRDIIPKFPYINNAAVETFHLPEVNVIIPPHILLPYLLQPMPAPVRYRNYEVFAARSS